MNRFRTLFAGMIAVGITFGLFVFMYKLISSGGGNNSEMDASKIKVLYSLFENIPVNIFAVHFHLEHKSIENRERNKRTA